MTAPAIRVDGLTKRYGGVAAVDGLTFDVQPGTVTAFLGPNGAGKTTTIRVLLGLTRPDEGRALVVDRPFTELTDPLREVGALIDGAGMDPRRTAGEHLAFVSAAAGLPRARAADVLETVELTAAARKKVGAFSLGMRQRLGLATALLGEPRLLVLDEPANGLDPAGTRWLRTFLRDYAAQGHTVFVSSHVLSEVALFADEVVVVDRGRLIQHTTVRALMADTVVRVRTPSVLSTPSRTRIVLAKAVVAASGAAVLAAVAQAVMLLILAALAAGAGAALSLGGSDAAAIAGLTLACAGWAAIGVGVGAVVRHQVAAIVGAVLWVLIIENLGASFLGETGRFLPGQAALALAQAAISPDMLPATAAAALLAGYIAAALTLAAVQLQRTDV